VENVSLCRRTGPKEGNGAASDWPESACSAGSEATAKRDPLTSRAGVLMRFAVMLSMGSEALAIPTGRAAGACYPERQGP
jgi:hypothetical protein